MRSTRFKQIVFIALTGGLIAFIFLNGRNNSTALANSQVHAAMGPTISAQGFDFQKLETEVKAKLAKTDADEVMRLESELKVRGSSKEHLLTLAEKYDQLKQPILAGYYYQKVAEIDPSEKNWFKAGRKFFESQQLVDDTMSFAYFVDLSINAFDKVLKMNPNNFEAKSDQAVNLIEGKGQTMEGIGMLREVLQVDSTNRKALYYLGILSIRSHQYDKAITRFEKLVALGPDGDNNYPYYFRFLGQSYAATGQKEKAIQALHKYKQYTDQTSDTRLKKEADELLQSVQ